MSHVVILAGGNGANLRPLTYELPKALIPMFGRTLLDHVVDIYFKHNIFEWWLSLCVHHKGGKVLEKYPYPYLMEQFPIGSGGWLKGIKIAGNETLAYFQKEDFYVSNVDNLATIDLKDMMKKHKASKAVITIAVTKVRDVSQYGAVHVKNGKIINFQEKEKTRVKQPGYINAGYYIFSPKIFDYIEISEKRTETFSLERDLFPKLAKAGVLYAYQEDFDWTDTSSMESYSKILTTKKGLPKNE